MDRSLPSTGDADADEMLRAYDEKLSRIGGIRQRAAFLGVAIEQQERHVDGLRNQPGADAEYRSHLLILGRLSQWLRTTRSGDADMRGQDVVEGRVPA
jgi:hypothetical protein